MFQIVANLLKPHFAQNFLQWLLQNFQNSPFLSLKKSQNSYTSKLMLQEFLTCLAILWVLGVNNAFILTINDFLGLNKLSTFFISLSTADKNIEIP